MEDEEWQTFISQNAPAAKYAIKWRDDEIERLKSVFIEAQRLIHSGYDGPFMGEAISDLVKAVLKAEMGGCDENDLGKPT